MTTIIERDAQVTERLTAAIGTAQSIESIDLLKTHLDNRPDEFAIVLGPSVPMGAAVSLADTLRLTRPSLGVILVRSTVDTTVLAGALRSGMREVVPLGDLTGLGPSVQRARDLYEALSAAAPEDGAHTGGKVITVFSAKGGVGKTTISTNLAVALAADGANEVCVVDLDLSFGDVAISLQIFPTRTIADTVQMEAHLDGEGLESLLTRYRDGVFALAAPVEPDAKESISADLVAKILRLLRQRFDYVVVDTPPAFDDQVLQAFDESDLILLIATPDIPALKNLKIACETIHLLNIPRDSLRVVLNRADSRVGLSPSEVAGSLGMEIATSIPSSRDVPTSVNRGELLFDAAPRHPVSQAIAHLATAVVASTHHLPAVDEALDDGSHPADGGRRRKTGMFARKGKS